MNKNSLHRPINTFKLHRENLSVAERFAVWLTHRVGTIGFFFIICLWTLLWLGFNTLAPPPLRFDPYPAFVLWLFISNMIQIFLMPLIMVGQNLDSKHSEIRAENDYHINLKTEAEVAEIKQKLDLLLQEINELRKQGEAQNPN
ncbi:MAG: DUF1003 domain-containing protein [Bacteroidales bacterium]